jgi:hypothetical protein
MAATCRLVVPWMRVSAQRASQRSRLLLSFLQTLEAASLQGRFLRVVHARFDLPLIQSRQLHMI